MLCTQQILYKSKVLVLPVVQPIFNALRVCLLPHPLLDFKLSKTWWTDVIYARRCLQKAILSWTQLSGKIEREREKKEEWVSAWFTTTYKQLKHLVFEEREILCCSFEYRHFQGWFVWSLFLKMLGTGLHEEKRQIYSLVFFALSGVNWQIILSEHKGCNALSRLLTV